MGTVIVLEQRGSGGPPGPEGPLGGGRGRASIRRRAAQVLVVVLRAATLALTLFVTFAALTGIFFAWLVGLSVLLAGTILRDGGRSIGRPKPPGAFDLRSAR
jgi:hypothetical protein